GQFAGIAFRYIEVAQDDGQKVVEVVGNAPRQLADGFHFLRLKRAAARLFEHLLRLPPHGDVSCHFGKSDQFSTLVVDRIDQHAGPEFAAVLAQTPTFPLVLSCLLGLTKRARRDVCLAIFRRVEPGEVLSNDFMWTITLDALRATVPARDASLRIEHVDRVVLDRLHEELEVLLARPQETSLSRKLNQQRKEKNPPRKPPSSPAPPTSRSCNGRRQSLKAHWRKSSR